MSDSQLEPCPGCGALLPRTDGPTHRYLAASAACWALFTALHSGGEPPMVPDPYIPLLTDAYAAQHPGTPSDQSIQSVAVHLLTLQGVLVRGVSPGNALWVRRRALRERLQAKHDIFRWLEPPQFSGSLAVAEIVQAPTPAARTGLARRYIEDVWSIWAGKHGRVISAWYADFVLPD